MKAFLLAAGLGTRLRPLTDTVPKCMAPIGGRPLLDIWLDALAAAGVDEVLINLHHRADVVREYIDRRTGGPAVRLRDEPELLGSAGTLSANRAWVAGEEMFLACYADNLTDFRLSTLVSEHRRARPVATLAVFEAEDPKACGIVTTDGEGRVVGYEEKPSAPASRLANAGVYAFSAGVLDELEALGAGRPADIGYDLLPRLVGRARAIRIPGYLRDIGTPASYHRAQVEWKAAALR